jgi:chemotaxis protein CheX
MKVEFVTPFVQGAISVMEMVLGSAPERGPLSARPQVYTTQQLNVVCGITGQVEGNVIYGMPIITADKIASRMLGQPVVTFDALAASAIAELGNMISGNSATLMAGQGFHVDITPPTIVKGTNVKITSVNVPALMIPLRIEGIGEIELNVSLRQAEVRAAA